MNGNLTWLQRFWLAFVAFFAVLFDRRFAEAVHVVRGRLKAGSISTPTSTSTSTWAPTSPPASTSAPASPPASTSAPASPPASTSPPPLTRASPQPPAPTAEASALHVLHLLQRDGRLVDFLYEDLDGFSDGEIGAAARTVHEGCRKTLTTYLELEPVYREAEGARVTVGQGFDPGAVRLTGNVVGAPPFQGSLKHHGWRVKKATFPPAPAGEAVKILAPAEVEL